MTQLEQFIAEVDRFLEKSGMTPTAFGKSALNDPNFVGDLRSGRRPNLGLVDRVHNFISENEKIAKEEAAQ
jgi:hypothetical protein